MPEAIHDTFSSRDLVLRLYHCVSEQGNLLLSVAPKGDGTVDDVSRQSIEGFGDWVRDHAEAVYGTFERSRMRMNRQGNVVTYQSPGISKCANWSLKNSTTAYLWVQWWPGSSWPIGNFDHEVIRVTLARDGREVAFRQDGRRVEFYGLPHSSPDKICRYNILKIEFNPHPDLC